MTTSNRDLEHDRVTKVGSARDRGSFGQRSADSEGLDLDCHFTDNFMHSRSRYALPRLRESIGIRVATVATKPAVRSCLALGARTRLI